MINYIKSEIYRNIRSKSNYMFIILAMAFVILLNVVLWIFGNSDGSFPYNSTKYAFSSLYTSLQFPFILSVWAVNLIFSQEYKNHTFKNTISFGISRKAIYFTKFFISIVYAFIATVFVVGAFVISGYMLLENSGTEYLRILINSIVMGAPIFLFSLTLAHCFYFVTDKELNVFGIWAVIVIVIPQLLSMAGRRSEICSVVASYMPWNIIGDVTFNETTRTLVLGWTTKEGALKALIVGVIGCLIFYFIGLKFFKKKEIN